VVKPNNLDFVLASKIVLIVSLPFSLGSILGHLLGKAVRED